MTVGHNIIALFSEPDRKVRNVPKRLLNGVMEYVVGSGKHWRARFDEVLRTLPPRKGYRIAGGAHSDLSYVGKNNGFPVSSHDLFAEDWEWTRAQRCEKDKRLLLAWKTEPRYWIDWVWKRANVLELRVACAENGIDVEERPPHHSAPGFFLVFHDLEPYRRPRVVINNPNSLYTLDILRRALNSI